MAQTSEKPGTPVIDQRQLTRLKWFTTLVPACAIYLYETVRHGLLEPLLPTADGNLIAGLLALVLAYGFSELVMHIVARFQADAVKRSRELATLTAMTQERERLSRELHDSLAQVVAYLLVRVDTVSGLVREGRTDSALDELEQLRGIADDLYVDVREAISGLRTPVTERGLSLALRDYLAEFEERHAIRTHLESGDVLDALSPAAEVQLFRVIQEALANVRKHAGASQVWVCAAPRDLGGLEITIRDDGCGFDLRAVAAAPRWSFGLLTMRERVASLGGTLSVESQPRLGTRIVINVPVGAETREASGEAVPIASR